MVVDASVLVSYFLPQDVNHLPSVNWTKLQLASNQPLIGPELLIPEIGGAIARRIGQAEARQAESFLKNSVGLTFYQIDEALATAATRIAIDLRLRGADAVYVALAQQLNLALITWDREIINRTAGVIQVQTP